MISGHGQIMTSTFDTHWTSLTHLFEYLNQLEAYGCNSFQIIHNFHFCPCKSLCNQIWSWHKIGHGQPRVVIWTILVVLAYTMLHIKFQGHRSIGSGEQVFLRFLPYMGMAAILVMWSRPFEHFPKGPVGCIRNLVTISPVVSEEKSFEIVDGRTTELAYTKSSPGAFGSGELKNIYGYFPTTRWDSSFVSFKHSGSRQSMLASALETMSLLELVSS